MFGTCYGRLHIDLWISGLVGGGGAMMHHMGISFRNVFVDMLQLSLLRLSDIAAVTPESGRGWEIQ